MDDKQVWETPEIDDLGDAETVIQDISQVGSGDTQYSVLNPS